MLKHFLSRAWFSPHLFSLTLIFFYLFAGKASAEPFLNIGTKLKYDSNLTNARFAQDIVDGTAIEVDIDGGYYMQLSDFNSLRIQGELSAEAYDTYHGMNNLSLGAKLILKRKWGLGLYEPWSSLSLSAARLDFNNNLRDGYLYTAQIGAGKRITERWNVGASLSVQKRTQDDENVITPGISGAPFNLNTRALSLDAAYAFNDSIFLTLNYQLRRGDLAAATITKSPLHAAFDPVTTAETSDTAFGVQGEVYRLSGTKHQFGAGIHTELKPNLELGLEYQRSIIYANGGNNYYKSMPAITLFYGF